MRSHGFFARLGVIIIMALAVAGCNFGDVASAGSLAVSAASAVLTSQRNGTSATAERLDPEKLDVAEKRAKDAFVMLELATAIAPSVDPDVRHPNFCKMAIDDIAVLTDAGGLASALTCKIEDHLDQAGVALKNGDKPNYDKNLTRAESLTDQLTEMIRTAQKGVSP
jgi:hypothetical protein